MNCKKVREVMFLLADDEIDGDLVVSFRKHVSVCPQCARRSDYALKLLVLFRQRCARTNAPQRLRERILTSLPHRGPVRRNLE